MKPLVSLILTTYNCRQDFIGTMDSIQMQDYERIEIVIKDGVSTDGTLDEIENYKKTSKYPVVMRSEPDKGIFDAMTKGVKLSSGDIVAICNERYLRDDAVSTLVQSIEGHPGVVGAHCDLDYMEGDKVIRRWRMGEGTISQGWLPGHPALYLKREIYEKYGYYKPEYKIAADYEFMIRFLKDGQNQLAYIPEVLIGMYYGGTSTSGLKSYIDSFKEGYRALRDNQVRHALWVNIKRTFRVMSQFRNQAG